MGGGREAASLPLEQYRVLIENAPIMVWRAGLDNKCNYFNETWLRFTGRALQQEIGDGWAEGVHADDLEGCLHIYLDHFRRREAFGMEYRLRRHDGVYRWIFDRGVPLFDDDGKFGGFIGSCVDVHERHEADAARARFLGVVARELATPIQGLSLLAAWLQRDVESGNAVDHDLLERLVQRVQRLDGVIAEFADAARLEEETPLAVEIGDVDLEPLVRKVVGAYSQVLAISVGGARQRALRLEIGPGSFRARVDSRRIEQILKQLLENAVKYSAEADPIDVALTTRGGELHLAVTDRGIGIPRDEIAHVTRRYYRASNAPLPELAGLGLGLAIASELCGRQHGRLEISSVVGRGTSVTIKLPVPEGRSLEA